MTKNKTVLAAVVVATLAVLSVGYAAAQRTPCPGKVICPLTGDTICADHCPLSD